MTPEASSIFGLCSISEMLTPHVFRLGCNVAFPQSHIFYSQHASIIIVIMWTRVVIWYHIFMMNHHSQNGYLTQNHNHLPHSHCSSQDRLQCTSEPRKQIFEGIIIFCLFISILFDPFTCNCLYSYFPLVWQTFCFRFPIGLCPVWEKEDWVKSGWSILKPF